MKPGFFLDFYCANGKGVIEIDGTYHNNKQQTADAERTELLNEMEIRVIRFTNEQVLEDTEAVLGEIAHSLEVGYHSNPTPHTGALRRAM